EFVETELTKQTAGRLLDLVRAYGEAMTVLPDRYQCSRDVVVNPRELRSVRIQVNLEKSLDQVAKLRRLCSTARLAHRASDECADAVPDERNDFVEGECATSVFREQRVQGRQQIRCAIDQSSVQIEEHGASRNHR